MNDINIQLPEAPEMGHTPILPEARTHESHAVSVHRDGLLRAVRVLLLTSTPKQTTVRHTTPTMHAQTTQIRVVPAPCTGARTRSTRSSLRSLSRFLCSRLGQRAAVATLMLLAIVAGLIYTFASGDGAPPSTRPPGTIQQWITQADQVLTQNGTPVTELNDTDLWIIIQHESGGNPNAINLNDSNAAAGNPSKGLMQTTASTFHNYALPGHGNIYNPVDNIIAGTRYAIARYGSLNSVPGVRAVHSGGQYVGY